jgi:hypothetical protein
MVNNGTGSGSTSVVTAANALAGVIVVVVALAALAFMTAYLVSAVSADESKVSIASAALAVIGTVVGAFFGVHASSDARRSAEDARTASDIKVEELSRSVDEQKGKEALDRADERIRALR